MSFNGKFEGKDTSGAKVRIVLDGDTADISAGGNGRGGDVKVANGENQVLILLSAGREQSGGSLPIDLIEPGVVRISGDGSITVGDVTLTTSKRVAQLRGVKDAQGVRTGELFLGDGEGNTITLRSVEGDNAVIRAGATKKVGWVALSNAQEKEVVLLGGSSGMLELRDNAGQNVLTLRTVEGNNAVIRVGGQKKEGWISLWNGETKETVVLGGSAGLLELRDAKGTTMIQLKAATGAGRFGGQGVNGDVLVFSEDAPNQDSDQAAVWIQGSAGDIVLRNADCAEEFDVVDRADAEPGTVLVITDTGELAASDHAYDTRVAGVVSGAGGLRPGIRLGRVPDGTNRTPVALVGKVFCKVDAASGSIGVGSLLTTSNTPGHAMRVSSASRTVGAVLGKALAPHDRGLGMIPILVALQ